MTTIMAECFSQIGSRRGGRYVKYKLLAIITGAFLLSSAGPVFAHHSFAATYDTDKEIKVEGTVKEFIWRNPHSFIKVEAPDDKGAVQTWVVEWAAPTQLAESRLTRTSLKPGDKVVIVGQPGRDSEQHRVRVKSVTRP